jgi:Haemolysin-III related
VFGVMMVPYATTIWWGYRCQPAWRYIVLALYYASAAWGLLSATLAKSTFYRCADAASSMPDTRLGVNIYALSHVMLQHSLTEVLLCCRALPMGMLVVVRVVSLAHRAWLGTSSVHALWHYASMEVVCTVGAVVNVYRVPECWLHTMHPKDPRHRSQLLDYWGNSHQIMHVLAVIAMWHIYKGTRMDSEHVLADHPCP